MRLEIPMEMQKATDLEIQIPMDLGFRTPMPKRTRSEIPIPKVMGILKLKAKGIRSRSDWPMRFPKAMRLAMAMDLN
jgi:hypothetical protein